MKLRIANRIRGVREGLICIVIAGVTGGVFWLAWTLGSQQDPEVTRFLESPGAVSRYSAAPLQNSDKREGISETPLVKVAKDLARLLEPPPKPAPTPSPPKTEVAAVTVADVKPAASTPKFELHGISYHSLRPEESMALVWLPDVGRKWVRQGTQLGHITIEQITSGSVLYRDGQISHEMALDLDRASAMVAQAFNNPPRPVASDAANRITARSTPVPPKRPMLPPRSTITDNARFAGAPHSQTVTKQGRQKSSPANEGPRR